MIRCVVAYQEIIVSVKEEDNCHEVCNEKTAFFALTSSLLLTACTAFAEQNPMEELNPKIQKTGLLSMLNISEEDYLQYKEARGMIGSQLIAEGYGADNEQAMTPPEGGNPPPPPERNGEGAGEETEGQRPPMEEGSGPQSENMDLTVVYYDSLDAMLMGLNAGEIDSMEIYQSVGNYLCATNDNLAPILQFDLDKDRGSFARDMFDLLMGNDFAFLLMEEKTELRDQLNEAIEDMKSDGILDRLIQEQIDDVIAGKEATPVSMPQIEGAPIIKIAVTGSLPPMDYVAPDGNPAGFNTAVLAEIADRAGLNIELVQVDSLGRAAALASGTVDAVFWTRTSQAAEWIAAYSEEERQEKNAESETLSEEEKALLEIVESMVGVAGVDYNYATFDMPEGTIATDPYYFDVFVPVVIKNAQ